MVNFQEHADYKGYPNVQVPLNTEREQAALITELIKGMRQEIKSLEIEIQLLEDPLFVQQELEHIGENLREVSNE